MGVVKTFMPLPGVTALRPSATFVANERKLAWIDQLNETHKESGNFSQGNTKALKQNFVGVMEEDRGNEKNGDETESHEKNGEEGDSVICDKDRDADSESDMASKDESIEIKQDETESNNSSEKLQSSLRKMSVLPGNKRDKELVSRCTSSKSNKTVKSVRFALPEESKERSRRGHVTRCEPFFGIPIGSPGSGINSRRPYSGWSITSTLGENVAGFSAFSSMKNRGSMSSVKQVPGRYFPIPTTLEDKRSALQETLEHPKQSRAKSAPLVASHNNFPRNPTKLEYYNVRDPASNTTFRKMPRSSPVKGELNSNQNNKRSTFWDKYESETNTFSISFRDTDTPTYDPVHLGKADTYFLQRCPSASQFSNTSAKTYRSFVHSAQFAAMSTVQPNSDEFPVRLEGTSKTLHTKK